MVRGTGEPGVDDDNDVDDDHIADKPIADERTSGNENVLCVPPMIRALLACDPDAFVRINEIFNKSIAYHPCFHF